jgi:DNA-binding NarL/FixJ family response regulator
MVGLEKSAVPRPRPLRLLIVDKEPAARGAFMQLCHQMTDLHIVGEAGSGSAAIDAVEDLAPDVMLIDVALPDMSGFDVLRLAGNSMGPLGITQSRKGRWIIWSSRLAPIASTTRSGEFVSAVVLGRLPKVD